MSTQNIFENNQTLINTINSSGNRRRGVWFRRRWESSRRIGQSAENNSERNMANNSMIENEGSFNHRNMLSNREMNVPEEGSISSRQNQSNIGIDDNSINNFRRIRQRNLGTEFNQSIRTTYNIQNNNKKLNKIEEEEKKKEEICNEENIGSEIKDTVKCYICLDKITKPKMCPHCHRIACEKCLYNWFIKLKKTQCGFCRENSNYSQMISVPFMDAVVNFVEKFFDKKKNVPETLDKEVLEYCTVHKNEMLYYYCLDCGKAYCKTCFVFFGQEKDKHNRHSIIEYEKYKKLSFPLLKKNTDKLDNNIQHIEENIKRCLAYKNVYEHERKVGNKFLKKLQNEFNKQIDEVIKTIDNQIEKLKQYINEYNKYKREVEDFYGLIKHKKNTDISCESLIIKLTKINQHKFFSSKELDKLIDLSKKIYVDTYHTKIGEFNHENMFLGKGLKMGSSPYEIIIDNKQRNEVTINLMMLKEKTPINHNYQSFIFIKKKGEGIQSYDLDEFKEDDQFYYLKKKIPWDYFGQSVFKIKGVLYDFYIS